MCGNNDVNTQQKSLACGVLCALCAAVRAFMRVCQSSQSHQGTCGFFGSGGYLLYEITEGQVGGLSGEFRKQRPFGIRNV